MKQKKGFTLLELLIVIAIIGTLSTLIFPNFMVARQKARDTKRQTDLKSIQTALDLYYSICNFKYPTTVVSGGSIKCTTSTPQSTLMATVPTDPINNTTYKYTFVVSDTAYTITAKLEIGGNITVTNQQ